MTEKIVKLPEEVALIIKQLNDAGFEAYAVGGCVRDCIMGRTPSDWDIATGAKPGDIKKLFRRTYDTGIRHGTVSVVSGENTYEVTTFRVDGFYSDNRRPSTVEFTASVNEDLSRRDFTVNAMAYHPETGVIDPFGGINDIRGRIIRTVGDPILRFNEDALRMLRAIRFSSQLNFVVEDATLRAIEQNARLIENISHERIREELTAILLSDYPGRIALLHDTGLMGYILPELEPCFEMRKENTFHNYSAAEHIIAAVSGIKKDRLLRWTMLLHDIDKPPADTTGGLSADDSCREPEKSVCLADTILKRFRFEKKFINKALRLIKYCRREIIPSEITVGKALRDIGEDVFPDLLLVKEADIRAQNADNLQERLELLENVRDMYFKMRAQGKCFGLKNLAVNGHDLLDAGMKPGREVKKALDELLDIVLENQEMNERSKLLEIIKSRYRQSGNPEQVRPD